MWIWIAITLIPIACCIYLAIDERDGTYLLGFIFLIFTALPLTLGIEARQNMDVFLEQKEFIENYCPPETLNAWIETGGLLNKQVELNERLYRAQWSREKFGIFSMYPVHVLEMEPIVRLGIEDRECNLRRFP